MEQLSQLLFWIANSFLLDFFYIPFAAIFNFFSIRYTTPSRNISFYNNNNNNNQDYLETFSILLKYMLSKFSRPHQKLAWLTMAQFIWHFNVVFAHREDLMVLSVGTNHIVYIIFFMFVGQSQQSYCLLWPYPLLFLCSKLLITIMIIWLFSLIIN